MTTSAVDWTHHDEPPPCANLNTYRPTAVQLISVRDVH